DRAEPGIRVGDMHHDDAHARGPRPPRGLAPPGGVHEQPALPPARRRPELDDLHTQLKEAVQQPVRLLVGLVAGFLHDRAGEAEAGAEALAQRRDVVGQAHRVGADDAELLGNGEHGLGLRDAGAGPLAGRRAGLGVAGARDHDVGVDVDQRAGVAEVVAVAEVDASDVVLGGRRRGRGCAHLCVPSPFTPPSPLWGRGGGCEGHRVQGLGFAQCLYRNVRAPGNPCQRLGWFSRAGSLLAGVVRRPIMASNVPPEPIPTVTARSRVQRITREQARKYAFDWEDEPLLRVRPGESFVIETYDASTGYFKTPQDKANPALRPGFDRFPPHANPIGGPVWLEGAERGDTLVLHLQE